MSKTRLETERKECGLTQEQVADYFGISRTTLYRREAGLIALREEDTARMSELYRRMKSGEDFDVLLAEAKAKRAGEENPTLVSELLSETAITLSESHCEPGEGEFPSVSVTSLAVSATEKRKGFPVWKIVLLVFLGIVALIAGLACYFLIGIISDRLRPHDAMASTWDISTNALEMIWIAFCLLAVGCVVAFVLLLVKGRKKR